MDGTFLFMEQNYRWWWMEHSCSWCITIDDNGWNILVYGAKQDDNGWNILVHGAKQDGDGWNILVHGAKQDDDGWNILVHGAKL